MPVGHHARPCQAEGARGSQGQRGVLNEEEFAAEKGKILSGEDMVKGTPVQSVQAAAPTSSINMTATQGGAELMSR